MRPIAFGMYRIDGVTDQRLAVGPRQWLGYIRGAAFNVTNSFHGTVFSLRYRKPFIVVPHTTRNERISGLLQMAGLQHLMYEKASDIRFMVESALKTDYDAAWQRLTPFIERSRQYLRQSVEI